MYCICIPPLPCKKHPTTVAADPKVKRRFWLARFSPTWFFGAAGDGFLRRPKKGEIVLFLEPGCFKTWCWCQKLKWNLITKGCQMRCMVFNLVGFRKAHCQVIFVTSRKRMIGIRGELEYLSPTWKQAWHRNWCYTWLVFCGVVGWRPRRKFEPKTLQAFTSWEARIWIPFFDFAWEFSDSICSETS